MMRANLIRRFLYGYWILQLAACERDETSIHLQKQLLWLSEVPPTSKADCFPIFPLIEAAFCEYLINFQQAKQEFKYLLTKAKKI